MKTAEEIFQDIWTLIDNDQDYVVLLRVQTILDCEQLIDELMEQYAKEKVLEALEKEVEFEIKR